MESEKERGSLNGRWLCGALTAGRGRLGWKDGKYKATPTARVNPVPESGRRGHGQASGLLGNECLEDAGTS